MCGDVAFLDTRSGCVFSSANNLVLVEGSLYPLSELLPQYLFSQMNTFDFFLFPPQPLCIQQISAHWQEWCIGLSLLFICNVLCINESHICLLPDKYLAAGRNVPTWSLAVKEWCVLGEYCWVNKIVSRHYAGQKGITGVLNGRWVIIDWSICVLK